MSRPRDDDDGFGRRLRSRWRALFDRNAAESDLDDELRFHLDMETEHQMRMGLPPDEAKRKARIEFGGIERYRDESRDARGIGSIEDLGRDVRVSLRSLRRAPGFALVSILTVALGVGTTTAVFSLIDGILLRPLPYPSAASLVRIYERSQKYPASHFSGANFLDVEARAKTIQSVAFFSDWPQTIIGLAEPVRADVAAVSDRFFSVLGVAPEQGRTFLPGEGGPGHMHPIAISDRFWRTTLGARPDWSSIILETNAARGQVVGIMPPGFSYPDGADLWIATTDENPHRTAHNWNVIGRLKSGRDIGDARTELDRMFGGLKAQLGKDIDAEGVTVRTLRESLTLKVRTLMWMLIGAVGFVLLVACANLASANLARGESQQRELAVRTSLGAPRQRLIRQLATEKVVLCVIGGILGIALAWALVRVAVALGPDTLPAFATVRIDLRVMAFALATAIVTGLLTGIIPALSVTSNLRAVAASGGGGSGKRSRFRRPLIAAEVALATMLLIGAGLFLRSFTTMLAEDPGYRVQHIVLADVTLPTAGYSSPAGYGDTLTIPRFFDAVLSRLRATPGIDGVAIANTIPLGGGGPGSGFAIDGGTDMKANADYFVVDSAYFRTMGIRLIRGRGFTSADKPGAEQVVVINREAADKYWPGADAIGHRIRPPGIDTHRNLWLTVVGIVDNVRQYGLDQPANPQMYVHYLQRPERLQSGTIVAVTNKPAAVGPAIRSAVAEADRNALVEITSMQQLLDRSVSGRRFSMTVLSAFSALALFLAAVGIYGVLAYAVVQRQREIGVRMALGSTRIGVRSLILTDAMRAVLPGLGLGLIGAFFTVRLITGMLYGIAPVDPITFIITPIVILAVSIAASFWPATRAARVDPMIAMRSE
jgi:putative ABC transport system permease protein